MQTPQQPTDVMIASEPHALAETFAAWLAERIAAKEGNFRMAICGGKSPEPLYRLLGSHAWRDKIAWKNLEVFWGDERFVPHDAADSNYHQAMTLWLSHVPIPSPQIIPFPTDHEIDACARDYELILRSHYGHPELDKALPLFDLVLLGIGEDGHTASLMPGSPALDEEKRWAVPMRQHKPQERLTLTRPALRSASAVAFLVSGHGKAAIIRRVRAGEMDLPAARIQSEGAMYWFIDRAAAGLENVNEMKESDAISN